MTLAFWLNYVFDLFVVVGNSQLFALLLPLMLGLFILYLSVKVVFYFVRLT